MNSSDNKKRKRAAQRVETDEVNIKVVKVKSDCCLDP